MNVAEVKHFHGPDVPDSGLAGEAQDAATPRVRDHYGLLAFTFYLGLSLFFVGRPVLGELSESYIGTTNDPSVYMWLLCWWPHAIIHHLNPIITNAVWAPRGFNLAWTTSMPLIAVIATPLTAALGPIATYNVLCIVTPVLAAWSCFLLCHRLTGNYLAAIIGGYIFGFSAYVLAESRGHLPLVLIFPVPLLVLLALNHMAGRITAKTFSLVGGVLLITAFLSWTELYATMTLFTAIALGLAMSLSTNDSRRQIGEFIIPLAGAYTVSLIAVLPFLYFFLRPGYPNSPINSPAAYSADLLNLVVPTRMNAIGGAAPLVRLSSEFPGNNLEASAYFGLPLVAIVAWFVHERWSQPATRVLIGFLAIVCLMMVGPRLHVAGTELFGMPWKLALHLPLIRQALPVRFSLYAFLALAIIASSWFAAPRPAVVKVAACALLVVSLCPSFHPRSWSRHDDTPAFFTQGDYRKYLKPQENVVVIPYGISGASMLWQARAGFYFRMAGGWVSITPREFQSWPIVNALLTSTYIPEISRQLCAFMAAHDAGAVLVDDGQAAFWSPMLVPIDAVPISTGDIKVYRSSAACSAAFRAGSALEMETFNDAARFSALISAADTYLAKGLNPARLTPMEMQRAGLLPRYWVNDPDERTGNGLYLASWDDQVAVGVVGSYEALLPLISRYRPLASEVLFPFPKHLNRQPHGDTFMRLLVMVFSRDKLSAAAKMYAAAR